MVDWFIATVVYSDTINVFKFLIILAAFFGWIPLVHWAYEDSLAVRAKTNLWTITFCVVGAVSFFIWLLIPAYIIGLLMFLAAMGGVSIAYIIHRNSMVADFEKIFTSDHLKNIFVNAEKKLEKASYGLSYITANGNEVPLPQPKSNEAFGFMITCEIMDDVIWRRASQVLFNPGKEDYNVIYVIDGIPVKQNPRNREEVDYLIFYMKELAGLEAEEKRKPQQGRFTINLPETEEDAHRQMTWELNTAGSTAGEQLKLIRQLDKAMKKINELGFNENQVESIETLRNETKGLVLISGPKGSGRTTTMYSLISNHDPFMYNINTLEKKPLGELQNITQQIYSLSDTGTSTYSQKLQTVLTL